MVQIRPIRDHAEFLNPTNGSWWIVQIRPPKQSDRAHSKASSVSSALLSDEQVGSETIHQLPLVGFEDSASPPCRSDLNNPPTAVLPWVGFLSFHTPSKAAV